ncbi:hypothetical protein [Micromonospora sp. NPDC049497]|uniref:hypothetical protein n=1 Tax=Micromonospora sp. NPDC049497 TaxID=3364273 RepID=UPI00379BB4AF
MKTFVKALAALGAALMVASAPATAASAEAAAGGNSGWTAGSEGPQGSSRMVSGWYLAVLCRMILK